MAFQNLLLTNRHLQDLNPLIAGEEICDPGHSFGPAVRKYTLIHYVLKGNGKLYARGNVYPVHAGQAFLILPGEVTTYIADQQTPWHYRWIGFDGRLCDQFALLPPVWTMPELLFGRLMTQTSEYILAGELFSLYPHLFSHRREKNPHVQRVENLIRSNYMHRIRVEQIARDLNLNRRYLSRIFKECTGFSIQEFLIRVRLEEAEKLLLQGCSVSDAAALTGYEDVSNFSKIFKKHTGRSPAFVRRYPN